MSFPFPCDLFIFVLRSLKLLGPRRKLKVAFINMSLLTEGITGRRASEILVCQRDSR
jgi:hypothetical protein